MLQWHKSSTWSLNAPPDLNLAWPCYGVTLVQRPPSERHNGGTNDMIHPICDDILVLAQSFACTSGGVRVPWYYCVERRVRTCVATPFRIRYSGVTHDAVYMSSFNDVYRSHAGYSSCVASDASFSSFLPRGGGRKDLHVPAGDASTFYQVHITCPQGWQHLYCLHFCNRPGCQPRFHWALWCVRKMYPAGMHA